MGLRFNPGGRGMHLAEGSTEVSGGLDASSLEFHEVYENLPEQYGERWHPGTDHLQRACGSFQVVVPLRVRIPECGEISRDQGLEECFILITCHLLETDSEESEVLLEIPLWFPCCNGTLQVVVDGPHVFINETFEVQQAPLLSA